MSEPATGARPGRGERERLAPGTAMALFALCLGVFLIANDFTALNVALPAIERDFDVGVSTAQWVINAYALVFGMALVTGGRLADMFGRRRVFLIGAVVFGAFSALSAVAPGSGWLIATRVGMGIGGALLWPAILGMAYAALPSSRAPLAGALIVGTAGLGNAFGPLLGGVLTDELSWRWIFLLNIPIGALAVAIAMRRVPAGTGGERERIDYPGIVALSLGLLLVLLAFDQAADWGWGDARVIGMLAVAGALIAAFGVIEPRMGEAALIPADVLRNGSFRAACLVILLLSAVFFSTVFYAPQFMQKNLGYSALESGVGMLPMLAGYALVSFFSSPIYARLGAKPTVTFGAACSVVGVFVLSMLEADSGYGLMAIGLALVGLGIGVYGGSVTTAAVTALDDARASLAGGRAYMCQIAGGALGLGLTTAIFTRVSEQESFIAGIQSGFRYVAIVGAAGVVIALLFVGGRLRGSSTFARR
jgi:EmrB/QacA subfamily drug resistance transporter